MRSCAKSCEARVMMERTLYPRKIPTLFIVAVFAALALFLPSMDDRPKARIGALMFGLATLAFAARLFPGVVYLKLTPKGFEYKNCLPAKFVKWSDVDHFTTYNYRLRHYVGWVYTDSMSVKARSLFWPLSLLTRPASRFLGWGVDDGFSLNFEMNHHSLVKLLERWRACHTAPIGSAPISAEEKLILMRS